MATLSEPLSSSRLRRLARRAAAAALELDAAQERCELCSELLMPAHRHLLDIEARQVLCACRACTILFDRGAAGGEHYRLVPTRRLRLDGLRLDDLVWAGLGLPVSMAFFFYSTPDGRMTAAYPSPMGATRSPLELDMWEELAAGTPVLRDMEPDVEALLVNRARGAREHWLVPVDDCYRLVAIVRSHWTGFTGGRQVWEEIDGFFTQLNERGRIARRAEEAT